MTLMPMLPPTTSPAAPLSAEAGIGSDEAANSFAALLTGLLAPVGSTPVTTSPAGTSPAPGPVQIGLGAVGPQATDGPGDLVVPTAPDALEAGVPDDSEIVPGVPGAVAPGLPTAPGAPGVLNAAAVAASFLAGTPSLPVAVVPGAAVPVVPGSATLASAGAGETSQPDLAAPTHAGQDDPLARVAGQVSSETTASPAPGAGDPAGPPTLLAASSSTASAGSNGTVATPAVTAPANATAPATTSQPNPVTTQVVDRIAEMVTSAGSTGEAHRVTLKLQPEALGDVRIVLTVRDGAVHVQLSAHEAAARTLVEDSPELRRMLDLLGTPDARITVREVGTSHGGSWLSNQADQQATGQSNNDSNGQRERDGEHNSTDSNNDQARTPGRSTATDGTDVVTSSSQRTQTVGSHRSTGVDLAM